MKSRIRSDQVLPLLLTMVVSGCSVSPRALGPVEDLGPEDRPSATTDAGEAHRDSGLSEMGADDAGAADAEPPNPSQAQRPLCSDDGWCWAHPLTGAHALNSVAAIGRGEAWAVGRYGTIQRVSLQRPVEAHRSGTEVELLDVWAGGPTLAFAVGRGGTILRWDGAAWRQMNSGSEADLTSVWAAGPNAAWVTESIGSVLEWDGSTWTRLSLAIEASNLNDIWGFGPDDIWVVGANQIVLRRTEAGWTQIQDLPGWTFDHVWGSGPSDVYISGPGGTMLHFDGEDFEAVEEHEHQEAVVWGSGPTDVWAVGSAVGYLSRYDGTTWNLVSIGTEDEAIASSVSGWAPDDVWAVGPGGLILHHDGSAWSERSIRTAGFFTGLADLWVAESGVAFAAGHRNTTQPSLLRMEGPRTERVELLGTDIRGISAIWGTSQTEIWLGPSFSGPLIQLLQGEIIRWPLDEPGAFLELAGSSPENLWGLSRFGRTGVTLHRWNGTTVTSERLRESHGVPAQLPGALRTLWAGGPDNVWAASDDDEALLRWDGIRWTQARLPRAMDVLALWAAPSGELSVVGRTDDRRFAVRWHPNRGWSELYLGSRGALHDVWGNGQAVWAVGDEGLILRFENDAVIRMDSGTEISLRRIMGGGGKVWVAGQGNASPVLRHDSGGR